MIFQAKIVSVESGPRPASSWTSGSQTAPPELEESLRNGVYLAKLAHFFAPAVVAARKIFDADLAKYAAQGLHFRHTDNINYFLQVRE